MIAGAAFCIWGWRSWEYALAFVVAETVVFVAMIPLVYGATYYCKRRAVVLLASLCCGVIAAKFSVHGEPAGWGDWIGMWDTGMLTAMGIAAAIGSASLTGTQRKLARILMVMWLALASFHFSYTRNFEAAIWSRLNNWLPTAIVTIGCLWLARIDRMVRA